MRLLIVATAVAPLGQGSTGGISLQLETMAKALAGRGHALDVIALPGSETPAHVETLISVAGSPQPSLASAETGGAYPVPVNAALGHMWTAARQRQRSYDVIINLAHDWLPYYLTPFFDTPVLHIVNMGDVNPATTAIIQSCAEAEPARVAFLSRTQAGVFNQAATATLLPLGLDLSAYTLKMEPGNGLAWAGRISAEKGLEDALAVAAKLQERLTIAGPVEQNAYWQELNRTYQNTIDYRGFLNQQELQSFLGQSRVLLQTQKWQEAFGLVTIEAMACGTPVIAYDRGANTELIRDGETGFLVPPDSKDDIIRVLPSVPTLDRKACRKHVEQQYSLDAFSDRLDHWINSALTVIKAS